MVNIAFYYWLIDYFSFFSGSETALTGASKAKLTALKAKGSKMASRALALKENGESLLGALLLGNNLVNILATSSSNFVNDSSFQDNGVIVATFTMTFLILVFAEIMPKTYAITNPESVSIKVAGLVKFLYLSLPPSLKQLDFLYDLFSIFLE